MSRGDAKKFSSVYAQAHNHFIRDDISSADSDADRDARPLGGVARFCDVNRLAEDVLLLASFNRRYFDNAKATAPYASARLS
jgi:hypothetical protein